MEAEPVFMYATQLIPHVCVRLWKKVKHRRATQFMIQLDTALTKVNMKTLNQFLAKLL